MLKKKIYTIVTRSSLLACTQAEIVINAIKLKNPHCEFKIVKIKTTGDKIVDKPIKDFGGIGIFVKELEKYLLDNKADFAVHSLKDVPAIQPAGLLLASFTKRENPCDVFLTKDKSSLETIKKKFVVGTSSLRRIIQIANIREDAVFKDLRGNIDTRIKKLYDGHYDAIVIAAAGLIRLNKYYPPESKLHIDTCIPAIGQGALVLECRNDDADTIKLLKSVNDYETELAVTAERSFMINIGGGCKCPMAAHAYIENSTIKMSVMVGDNKNMKMVHLTKTSSLNEGKELGKQLACKIKILCKKTGIDI